MAEKLPPSHEHFQKLADAALSGWAPGGHFRFYELKATGQSGSAVVKIDITPAGKSDLEPGQYILKLSEYSRWPEQDDEVTAHERAENHDRDFAERHIPKLRERFLPPREDGLGYALLYEVAGRSLDSYAAVDVRESPGFLEVCSEVARDILAHWVESPPTQDFSPAALLEAWLGYRLDPIQGKNLREFASTLGGRTRGVFIVGGEALPDPLAFYDFAKEEGWAERAAFNALLHNDLHGGNLLVHRRDPTSKHYWIIDFALSRTRPAGFDQAYLELAHILYCIGDLDPSLLLDLLRFVDHPEEKRFVPSGTKWLLDVIQILRRTTARWFARVESRRLDDANRQFALARIAAGLNWANKPISDARRAVAFYYAGWACKQFLHAYESDSAARFWRLCGSETLAAPMLPPKDEPNHLLWEQLWSATDGFSPRAGRFILVSEAHRNIAQLAALGQLPWSVVVDLDPQSQELGLYHAVEPVIDARRSVHTSNSTFGPIDFVRGTAWMMAAGWSLKSEAPTDYNTWRFRKLEQIRAITRTLEDQTNPDPLIVLSIAGSGLDADRPHARLEETLDGIEEVTKGRATVFHIGAAPLSPRIRTKHLPLDLGYFLTSLTHAFGSTADTSQPQIPGKERKPRPLPLDSLRAMEENLHVLHSAILDSEPTTTDRSNDAFWRGNPPTWFDLHAGVDIRRDIADQLVRNIKETLEDVRSRTILLHHAPGSGGTTAALRAAWDLHMEYPTAVLHRYSAALPDRLQDLYNRAESPILVVADSATLSEAAREDLYREMQHRNVRMVLLYVRRVFNAPPGTIAIADPMERDEARRFRDAYAQFAADAFRRDELERITKDDDFRRYRTPFFYGLTAFERDFQGTRTYVANHIVGLRGKRREILEYLSLVTVFSNSGLHEVFLRRMLGLADSSSFEISEALGEGPVRLTIRRNSLFRLMHQVIAEQVLDQCQGANWRLELQVLSVDFISDLARFTDAHSTVVIELLRQMFVERQGLEIDDVEDRQRFSPLIETADAVDTAFGHTILTALKDSFPAEAHFWNHLGRHQIYRMKRDLDKAETYLTEATRLSPDDFIHHHTLGLVRKFRVRQAIAAARASTAAELIREITPLFDRAVSAFERTREINQDNIYAYITHVQMILEVASKLKLTAAVRTVAQIPGEAQEWVQDQVAIASSLIDTARDLYTTLEKTDTFLTSCVADLEKLYDNLDDVIEIWELAQERTGGSAVSRRALAYAYVNRSGERWSSLQLAELRRIVGLMELNLRHSGRREDDYKLWFETYKLLPEFDIDEALSRLRIWAERFPSWRAYFYMYAIQFHLWFSGRTQRTDELENALEQCKAAAFGRTNISHSWLGFSPAPCPLVASADLGEWDRKKNLWKSTEGLRQINGVIDLIHGPQAGWIVVDGRLRVFFVPGKEFSANKDENEPVRFFVGFSPSGIRARGIERGWVVGGARTTAPTAPAALFAPSIVSASEDLKKHRATALRTERVRAFAHDLVRAKATLGLDVNLEQLESAIDARFGVDGVVRLLGQVDVRNLMSSVEGIRLIERDGQIRVQDELGKPREDEPRPEAVRLEGQVFRRYPGQQWGLLRDSKGTVRYFRQSFVRRGQWKNVKEGSVVAFKPDSNSDGDIAIDIDVLRQGDVRDVVRSVALEIVRSASDAGVVLTKRTLVQKLRNSLRGDIPGLTTGPGGGLEPLLKEADGISFHGDGDQRTVRTNHTRAIGRLPDGGRVEPVVPKHQAATAMGPRPKRAPIDPTAVGNAVKEILSRESTRGLSLQTLGARLKDAFPVKGPLAKHLGTSTFEKFLAQLEGVRLQALRPGMTIASLAAGQSKDQSPLEGKRVPARASETPTESQAVPGAGGERSDLQTIVDFIADLVDTRENTGRPLKLAELAGYLGKKFQLNNARASALGFRSVKALIATVPGIFFTKGEFDLIVRRVR